jgi:hypothetical protein
MQVQHKTYDFRTWLGGVSKGRARKKLFLTFFVNIDDDIKIKLDDDIKNIIVGSCVNSL